MIRVDTTLVGFESLRWLRGQISFIYRVNDDSMCLHAAVLPC